MTAVRRSTSRVDAGKKRRRARTKLTRTGMEQLPTRPATDRRLDRASTATEVDSLFDRIVSILEAARTRVVRAVNSEMVLAYWQIGRELVQHVQAGGAPGGPKFATSEVANLRSPGGRLAADEFATREVASWRTSSAR